MLGRTALAGLIFAATLAVGEPRRASAQCRLCSEATTQPAAEAGDSAGVRLQVDASLDFDRLVLVGSGGGSAVLLPNGERSTSGTLSAMSARAMVGSVTVRGEPGRGVRIELPRRITLHSTQGGQIIVEEIESNLPSLPKLDGAGSLTFQFGGRLSISGDAEGDYRGDVPIDADYL